MLNGGAATLSPRKKSGRRTIAVKMDAPIVKKAQVVADDRGIPVSEYLSEMVRGRVESDWLKIIKRAADAEGSDG